MLFRYLLLWSLGLVQLNHAVASSPSPPLLRLSENEDSRIIHGTPALLENTKHQVSIRDREKDNIHFGLGFLCGGSLISENVVLCAAHCFQDVEADDGSFLPEKDFVVVMGNRNRSEKDNNTLRFDIVEIVKYTETFNMTTYLDDIVLLILDGSVPADHPTIHPITLNSGRLKEGTVCQVTGWGKTEQGGLSEPLLTVDVPIIPPDKCNRKEMYIGLIEEGMICAGYSQGERDACQGDSGGPLVCDGIQTGIVSWGIDCAKPDQPGIYTDVAFYRHWILSKVKEYDVSEPKFASLPSSNNTVENGGGGGGAVTAGLFGPLFLITFSVFSVM